MRIREDWCAFGVYAVSLLLAGSLWAWQAPLTWDEERYYVGAAHYFAERLPAVPLDYPMPMPPAALIIQGVVYRLFASIAVLRFLSTAATIAAVAIVLSLLRDVKPRTSALILLMIGAFPSTLLNAFTLKHHNFLLLCVVGGFALWRRERIGLATVVLAIAALTHQIAVAMIVTLAALALFEGKWRRSVTVGLALLPLGTLIVSWRGARPPMHAAVFAAEPAMAGVHPAQLILLLFVGGAWIAPAIVPRLRVAAVALLPAVAALHYSQALQTASVYDRFAGPVSSTVTLVASGHYLIAIVAGGILAALGVAAYAADEPVFRTWSVAYAAPMLFVPYFFESYYALFITISWVMVRRRIDQSEHVWFSLLAIMFGVAYVVAKGAAVT